MNQELGTRHEVLDYKGEAHSAYGIILGMKQIVLCFRREAPGTRRTGQGLQLSGSPVELRMTTQRLRMTTL
mgnify:FL=1